MPGPRRDMLVLLVAVTGILVLPTLAHAQTPEAKVSVAGPTTPYLPNAVNEPALAIDANHPTVLAAGANDLVDSAPCTGSSCDLTPDIGISGIYFSLNEGASWVQPTYTGLTARSGTPQVGPIHTLPWYYENGMSSHGDPALAFGPQPGPGGLARLPASATAAMEPSRMSGFSSRLAVVKGRRSKRGCFSRISRTIRRSMVRVVSVSAPVARSISGSITSM